MFLLLEIGGFVATTAGWLILQMKEGSRWRRSGQGLILVGAGLIIWHIWGTDAKRRATNATDRIAEAVERRLEREWTTLLDQGVWQVGIAVDLGATLPLGEAARVLEGVSVHVDAGRGLPRMDLLWQLPNVYEMRGSRLVNIRLMASNASSDEPLGVVVEESQVRTSNWLANKLRERWWEANDVALTEKPVSYIVNVYSVDASLSASRLFSVESPLGQEAISLLDIGRIRRVVVTSEAEADAKLIAGVSLLVSPETTLTLGPLSADLLKGRSSMRPLHSEMNGIDLLEELEASFRQGRRPLVEAEIRRDLLRSGEVRM